MAARSSGLGMTASWNVSTTLTRTWPRWRGWSAPRTRRRRRWRRAAPATLWARRWTDCVASAPAASSARPTGAGPRSWPASRTWCSVDGRAGHQSAGGAEASVARRRSPTATRVGDPSHRLDQTKALVSGVCYGVKVLRPTRHKNRSFRKRSSQSMSLLSTGKLNLTQQNQACMRNKIHYNRK